MVSDNCHTFYPEGYSLHLYTGGPCQHIVADSQVLSHSYEEPHILSLKILMCFDDIVTVMKNCSKH